MKLLLDYLVMFKMEFRMEELKFYRLWKPISFDDLWRNADTSTLDDISESWFSRREKLKESSQEYSDFLEQLKREHAIETGIVERMYDLSKGVTETFIKEGFYRSYLSHGDTNISQDKLMNHLNDHLEAVDFVFDVVKENRPLSVGFIKDIHHLVTRHQEYAEGRDQFGTKLRIPLLKGTYKERENNPTREDGTVIKYCPPEQVASEMDNLIEIYDNLVEERIHPLVTATWFHHAFTTIHPFQDGNGRVARLLTSLIFIKYDFFPFTVLREEAKVRYIEALEEADKGKPQRLVSYFADVQKRNIQRALNVKEVTSTSFEEVQNILVNKLKELRRKREVDYQKLLSLNRQKVFNLCYKIINELRDELEFNLEDTATTSIRSCSFDNNKENEIGTRYQDYYFHQIVGYAKKHDYFFNRNLPKAWFTFRIEISDERKYQLGVSIHHYGYEDSTIAIGSFLEFKGSDADDKEDTTLPLDIPPHVISINSSNIESREKNIRLYLENALTLAMAQIASEI